jgi:hypothetical protein
MSSVDWVERVSCLTGATGTAKCYQKGTIGGPVAASFKTAATGGATISGNIIIDDITCETPVDGLVTFDHSFKFTGTVTVS